MTGGQHARRDPALHRDRQPQQANHVGDHRPRSADPGGEFIVGDVELVQQLLIGRRLFQRIQLRSVDVLQQGVAQQIVFGGLPHDRGDGGQAGVLGGAPPPLPHDQLVARSRSSRRPAREPRSAASGRTRGSSARVRRGLPRRTPAAAGAGSARSGSGSISRYTAPMSVGAPAGMRSAQHDVGGCGTQSWSVRRGVLADVGRPGRNQRRQASAEAAFLARRLGHLVSPLIVRRPRSASSRLASR